MESSSANSETKRKLGLKKGPAAEELLISSDDKEETLLASNSKGSSLTLLEEYAQRQKQTYGKTFLVSLICAGVSLTFAYLNFIKL